MPVRQRKSNEIAQQIVPLTILGAALVVSNPHFTVIDDEVWIIDAATHPARQTISLFLFGAGQHEHPPLYDLILHFWLRITGGQFDYLRIPSILFFLAGLFLLGRVARRFSGPGGALATIWLGALWPFGFHFARLATWYSFSFFLVSGLTLAYLKYLEEKTTARWVVLSLFCACLIWTNYFGWAVLACLAVDQLFRMRSKEPAATPKVLAGTASLLCILFIPLIPAFRSELASVNVQQGVVALIANAGFSAYSFFVSEAVAPWYWFLSVPAGLAIFFCSGVAVRWIPLPVRRFLICGVFLFGAMALLGILNTKRLLLIAPWILLAFGVAIKSAKPRWAHFGFAVALLIVGVIGWYGIYSRHYYSAPRFIEPWQQMAVEAASKIQGGDTVIADHPAFFFYLTYLLRAPNENGTWHFQGVLPYSVTHAQVYAPEQWLSAGRPMSQKMVWIRGGTQPEVGGSMASVEHELDTACGARTSRLMMRDQGYGWKHRFFPHLGEMQWRIEVHEYDCSSSNSKEIFQIPVR